MDITLSVLKCSSLLILKIYKMNLGKLNLSPSEMLGKEQLKTVFGGYARMKCCWTGTSNCSSCSTCATCDCVSGATAVYC